MSGQDERRLVERPPLEADATPIGRDWVEYAKALEDRLEAAERERAEYERGNLWVRRAAAERERAESAESVCAELERALEQVVKEYTMWAEDWNDGTYAYWKSDGLMMACIQAREALAAAPTREEPEEPAPRLRKRRSYKSGKEFS